MKVIVVDASKNPKAHYAPPFKEGEVVTVTQCKVFVDSYDVLEYPLSFDGIPCSWKKYRFIPLSTIDETTFERNYQTDKVC